MTNPPSASSKDKLAAKEPNRPYLHHPDFGLHLLHPEDSLSLSRFSKWKLAETTFTSLRNAAIEADIFNILLPVTHQAYPPFPHSRTSASFVCLAAGQCIA